MPAKPNRFSAADVVRVSPPTDACPVRHLVTGAERIPLDDLSGGELRTACSAIFPGAYRSGCTAEQMRQALANDDPSLLDAGEVTTGDERDAPELAAPAPAPASVPADAATDLANALARLVPAQSLDPEQVRTIAADVVAPLRGDLEALADMVADIRPTITHVHLPNAPEPKALEGRQHARFEHVLRLVAAGCTPMLVGPAGTGKTTLAHQVAEALGVSWSCLSVGPMTSTTAFKGYQDAHGVYVRTPFRDRWEHGGVFLLDEIDNGNPSILAELNMALANGHYAFPDGIVPRHPDFHFVAAANTHGRGANRQYVGRNALDGATLDRFVMVSVDPDEAMETELASAIAGPAGKRWAKKVQKVRRNAESAGLLVIVSPRSTIDGARMLAAGFSEQEAADARFLAGADDMTRGKLLQGVTLGTVAEVKRAEVA